MTGLALALILTAAFIHATWNLLVKRAGGGAAFLWLFALISTVLYAPLVVAVVILQEPRLGGTELLFLSGSTLLHLIYFLVLQRGYRVGDLSLVYPLARGTGPVLATIFAIALMGERPTPIALGGAGLIVVGVLLLTGGPNLSRTDGARPAVAYGMLTGVIIASYTLWDKGAVSMLLIPPLLLVYCSHLGRVALLAPVVVRRWEEVRAEWRYHRREAMAVALLCPLSYILVLTALVFTPVSYVAPAREISILIGAVMGTRLLAEGKTLRRLVAASAMVAGVVALALG